MRKIILVIGLAGLVLATGIEARAADIEAVLDDAAGAYIDSDGNMVVKGE